MTALEAALALGLPCLPCRGDNKAPAIPGPGGHKHATADPPALRALWRRYPGPLVGVRTGEASGLSVLDIDSVKHPEAEAWFAAHRARLPVTRMHQTRSGGVHLVLQHRSGVRNRQSPPGLAKGVDTRGEGGYAIWWPCRLPGSVRCAAGAVARLVARGAVVAPPAPAIATTGSTGSAVQVLQRLARRVIHTPEGQRNGLLFWAACRLAEEIRSGKIDERSGVAVLTGAALRAGLSEYEAERTIASCLRTGSR
jgi:hypothetical protein